MQNKSGSFLDSCDLQQLIDRLQSEGYIVVGPTIDQGAIVYDVIHTAADLPRGWTDRQEAGEYRLEKRSDEAYFGFVVGPHSWKRFLFPPSAIMATADRAEETWQFRTPQEECAPYAFLGVRACELAAIDVQDRVFLNGPYVDPIYKKRRESAFIIAVNCTQAAATCFCTSMKTGPRCQRGFDLALTEIDGGFVLEVGSDKGRQLLDGVRDRSVTQQELDEAEKARQRAVNQISRTLNTEDIRDLLLNNLEHPQWDDVAKRCLSCTNCTMVCPTCFCSSVSEVSDLTGTTLSVIGRGIRVSTSISATCTAGSCETALGAVIDSGSPTSWPPGTTSLAHRAVSVAAAVLPGARSASI